MTKLKAGVRWLVVWLVRSTLLVLLLILLLIGAGIVRNLVSSDRSGVLLRKTIALYWRSPAREAHEAAQRGDFRLSWAHEAGPSPSPSSIPGVSCDIWFPTVTAKQLYTSDMRLPYDDMHQAAALRFLARYDRAMVADPAFPYPELCAATGSKSPCRISCVTS